MLDDAIKLVELLFKLVSSRSSCKDKWIARYVDPVYELAEKVARDHLETFDLLLAAISKGTGRGEIEELLQLRRKRHQFERQKLRALLDGFLPDRSKLTEFEWGILGILEGRLRVEEECSALKMHALIPLLNELRNCVDESGKAIPSLFENLVRSQHRYVELSWQQAVKGRARYLTNST